MKKFFIIICGFFLMTGCSRLNEKFNFSGKESGCGASECHISSMLQSYYPMNDPGHQNHVERLKLDCTACHFSYDASPNHKNGKLENKAENELIVFFDPEINTSGKFDKSAASCSLLACHGNLSWVNPVITGCTGICHKAGNRFSTKYPVSPDPNESGSHLAHMTKMAGSSCEECHLGYMNSKTHKNGKLDDALTALNMIAFIPSRNPAAAYSPGSKECSATYCHGNFSGGSPASVSWNGSAPCGSCHPAGATAPASVKHTAHLSRYPDQCGYCHNGYTKNSTPANHLDFTRRVDFGYPHPEGTSGDPAYSTNSKTCLNVYCHGNFPKVVYNGSSINPGNGLSISWLENSTALCGSCHGSISNNYSSATHGKHTATNQIYFNNTVSIESCDACHNYGSDSVRTFGSDSTQGSYNTSKHADFSFDSGGTNADVNFKNSNMDLAAKTGGIVSDKTTWNPGSRTCSNSWCHGNFSGTLIGLNSSPVWLDSTTAACGTCHAAGTPVSNSHPKHLSPPYSYGCVKCHGAFTGHVNGTVAGIDLSVGFDSTNPGGSFDIGTKKCTDLYCHGNTTGGDWSNFTYSSSAKNNDPVWTSAGSVTCGSCHDSTFAALTTGSHSKHIAGTPGNYSYPCRRCHADSYSGDTGTLTAGHVDGILTVNPDANNPSGYYSRSGSARTCAGFYCHGGFPGGVTANIPDWKIASSGSCGTCHDNAPLKSNFGAHDRHTKASAYNYTCQHCHNGFATGNESTAAYVSTATHANFTVDVAFNGKADQGPRSAASYNSTTGACSFTYCHGDFASNTGIVWPEGNSANPLSWSNAVTAPCGSCHGGGSNMFMGLPATGTSWNTAGESHLKHAGPYSGSGYQYPCGFCHLGSYDGLLTTGNGTGGAYESGIKAPGFTVHANGTRDIIFYTAFTGSSSQWTSGSPGEGTCGSMYCHSDGWTLLRTGADPGGISSPVWGGVLKSNVTCISCHNDRDFHTDGTVRPAPRHNRLFELTYDHYLYGFYMGANPTPIYFPDGSTSDDRHPTSCTHCHKYTTSSDMNLPRENTVVPGNILPKDNPQTNNIMLYSNNRHVNRVKNVAFGADTGPVGGMPVEYTRWTHPSWAPTPTGTCTVRCHINGVQPFSYFGDLSHTVGSKLWYAAPSDDAWVFEP